MARFVTHALMMLLVALIVLAVYHVEKHEAPPEPDYRMQADCIAEFDYTHPGRSMMDNLIIALEVCRD